MFNIIGNGNEMFNAAPTSFAEILYEMSAEYKIRKMQMSQIEELLDFTGGVPETDEITVTFSDGTSAVNVDSAAWVETYQAFVDGLYETDDVTVSIKVKKAVKSGVLNVYNLEAFSSFLCGRSYVQLLENFTELFEKCGDRIVFRLLDINGSLRTRNIAFSDNGDFTWNVNIPRRDQLKNCEDAGVFLDRAKYPLLPQDFTVTGPVEGTGFENIRVCFTQLQRILSFVYVANSAYIANDKAILQFDPAGSADEYEFAELVGNETVPKIYDWIFKDEGCVDKASIARKIINVYCRNKEAILSLDDKILNSVKSDYVIYQKNHADQYIDMKNKISECIVDNARQMQELSHDVVEAFRNNFVAIIVFLMTVLLTDSIDFSQFLGKEVSPNVAAVCGLFTVGSLLYLIATILMSNQKWNWLEQSYNDLKNNYKKTLDDQDIEEAFGQDAPLKTAKEQYKQFRWRMALLWAVMIIMLGCFTGWLYANRNLQSESAIIETHTTEEQVEESDTVPLEMSDEGQDQEKSLPSERIIP